MNGSQIKKTPDKPNICCCVVNKYFWTHSCYNHVSGLYNHPAQEHQAAVIFANKMGGSLAFYKPQKWLNETERGPQSIGYEMNTKQHYTYIENYF